MLPVSTRQPERFVPADAGEGEAYLVQVPSLFDKARFRRDLVEFGVDYPGDAKLFAAMKDGIAMLAPANAAALIEEIEAFAARSYAERSEDVAASERMAAIAEMVAEASPELRRLAARRSHYLDVAPLLAARRFLVGIEGRKDVAFDRAAGLVREDVLEALGERRVQQIGFHVLALMHLGEDQRKNSAAPSPSGSTESPSSTAQPESPTEDPSAAAAG